MGVPQTEVSEQGLYHSNSESRASGVLEQGLLAGLVACGTGCLQEGLLVGANFAYADLVRLIGSCGCSVEAESVDNSVEKVEEESTAAAAPGMPQKPESTSAPIFGQTASLGTNESQAKEGGHAGQTASRPAGHASIMPPGQPNSRPLGQPVSWPATHSLIHPPTYSPTHSPFTG